MAAAEVRADIDSVKSSTGGGPLPPGTHPKPLPSQLSASSASVPPFASAPGGNRSSRAKAASAPIESKKIAASARSLGTTMLILGLLSIAITGGLAFYLANRKPVEIHRNEQIITTTETHNTRVVAPDSAAASDLKAIEDIKPLQDGLGKDGPANRDASTSNETKTNDWIDLITGRDVSYWRGSKQNSFPEDAWTIENESLRNLHGRNDQSLVTRENFRNFELVFEWKFSAGGNSGVFYGRREFQLVDNANHVNGKIPETACGSLCYFIDPNEKKMLKPAGEFNRGSLIVDGNHVEHWINGEKIVEYELGSRALKSLVTAGQFKNLPGYKEIDTEAVEVPIGFQSHSGNVWFRNIRIRRLDVSPTAATTVPTNIQSPANPSQSPLPGTPPSAPTGPLPWTNTDGKTIQAEFVRISSDAVVISKDDKEFSIPLTKLSSASRKQASECAGNGVNPSVNPINSDSAANTTPNLDYGLLVSYGMQTFA